MTVKINFFFFSVEIFKIEIFQSRLWRVKIFVEIVETRQDCRDTSRFSRFVKICQEISTLSRPKVSTDWEISTRKYKNPRTSRSRSRQTVEKRRKFQISTNFSISIETFWSGHCCRDEIETNFLTLSRFSRLSRLTLWRRRDRESRSRPRRDKSRPPSLNKTYKSLFISSKVTS